jgi:hypothetical protein
MFMARLPAINLPPKPREIKPEQPGRSKRKARVPDR